MRVANKKVIRRVTLRSLAKNRSHTFFTVFALALSVAMISAVCGFAASGRKMLFDFMGKDIMEAAAYTAMLFTVMAVFAL
jgi:hypothetical protein